MSDIWTLEWHSRRTGREGTSRWIGESAEECKETYEKRHPHREVKVVRGSYGSESENVGS